MNEHASQRSLIARHHSFRRSGPCENRGRNTRRITRIAMIAAQQSMQRLDHSRLFRYPIIAAISGINNPFYAARERRGDFELRDKASAAVRGGLDFQERFCRLHGSPRNETLGLQPSRRSARTATCDPKETSVRRTCGSGRRVAGEFLIAMQYNKASKSRHHKLLKICQNLMRRIIALMRPYSVDFAEK